MELTKFVLTTSWFKIFIFLFGVTSSDDSLVIISECVCHVSQWRGRKTITITSLSPVSGLLDASCHSNRD